MSLKFWYSHESVSCMSFFKYVVAEKILRTTVLNYTATHPKDHTLTLTAVRTSRLNYWVFICFPFQDHIHNQDAAANQFYISGWEKKGITFPFLNTCLITLGKIHSTSNKNCYRKVSIAHPSSILILLIDTNNSWNSLSNTTSLKKKSFTNFCVSK
jgi:hypothetical protein